MVFGEIVEPLTRALIDDEFEDYPDYVKPNFEWEGQNKVATDLEVLIFVEGTKLTKLFNCLVLRGYKPHCSLRNGNLQIFNITGGKYIVIYTKKELATGEVIEQLNEWLQKASYIYTTTSEPISNYQNLDLIERPETLIRKLSSQSNEKYLNFKKLESPNLVSGLGADILSFSLHVGLKCTLFVVYMNNSPLDSINVQPIIELMKSLDLTVAPLSSDLNAIASNLYL